MTQLQDSITSFVRQNPPHHAFVGFSGGIDSTALLLLLKGTGLGLTAVHFHHGIRGKEADDDAEWCRQFCLARTIDFRLIHLDVPNQRQNGESPEEAARRLRLEAWKQLVGDSDSTIFLAHHADDALEELFLRLARGSNCTGLTSLRPIRRVNGLTFYRPLYNIRKETLRNYLLDNGIDDWRTDSTNADCHYRRNAVRNRLLPLFTETFGTDAGLAQSLQSLKADADFLEKEAQKALDGINSIKDWQNLHAALLPRVFRLWRLKQDGVDEAPSRAFIESLAKALESFDGTPVVLQLDFFTVIRLSQRGLRLENTAPRRVSVFLYEWNWKTQPELEIPELCMTLSAYTQLNSCQQDTPLVELASANCFSEQFAADALPETLTIRPWQTGDRMVPFGHSSAKKLQDLFTDTHVPRTTRGQLPVILAGDTIIWVPSVRRAEFGRIDDATSRRLLIRCTFNSSSPDNQ